MIVEALKKEVYDLLPELRGHQEPTKDEVAAWEKAIEQAQLALHALNNIPESNYRNALENLVIFATQRSF